jgi:nucleoside-diphosphate-sugar epimerase|tara:strand:- start:5309 stop:6298 length:990 start_codon:yes stop_codon:yes gene_type:complete
MSSKVMVTGAFGWLGRTLIRQLMPQKREIVCVDFSEENTLKVPKFLKNYKKLKVVLGDIRNSNQFIKEFNGCDTVFNCAGLQHTKFTSDIYGVNRDGTANLLRSCIKAKVPKFIHVSSCSVHGENIDIKNQITEKTRLKPIHHIAKSKAQGESLIDKISKGSKIKTIILRPAAFYGTKPSKNRIDLVEKIRKDFVVTFGKNGFLRSYVDIEKVADALLLAEKYGKHGGTYLIGDENPITTLQLYEYIADELNVKLKLIRLPTIISRVFEKITYVAGEFNIHFGIGTTIGEFGRHIFFSSEKAIKELKYKPHESSEKGLREMARSAITSH